MINTLVHVCNSMYTQNLHVGLHCNYTNTCMYMYMYNIHVVVYEINETITKLQVYSNNYTL